MGKSEIERLKIEMERLKTEHEKLQFKINRLEQKIVQVSEHELTDIKSQEARFEEGITVVDTTELQDKSTTKITVQKSKPQKEEQDLEFRIGGTWLNRIGIIAVIFGLSYFLKYSFDNQWIGETGRVVLGILSGLVLLFLGEKFKNKYSGYAQGLIGGGNLAIFFSVYSSYQFYHLISPVFAFLFLLIVMFNTVFMAIRHNSLPIGILGIIGAYAIPFMIGSDDPSLWSLFSYLALVTTGVLGVSIYKKWHVLQYLSFIFNYLIYTFMYVVSHWDYSQTDSLAPFLTYTITLFVLYFGVATIYNLRKRQRATLLDIGLNSLNAFAFFAWSYHLLNATWVKDYIGFYALLLSLLYVYFGKSYYKVMREDKYQVYSLFVISFVFLTIAIPLQISGMYIGIAWFAEAIGLIYMAKKLNSIKIVYSGLVVLALGLLFSLEELFNIWSNEQFLLNNATLLLLVSIASIYLISYWVKAIKNEEGVLIYQILVGALFSLIFVGLTIENSHFFSRIKVNYFLSPEQLSLSGIWLIYAIVLFVLGVRKNNQLIRYTALGLLAIIILKAFFVDLSNLASIYKILLFIILGISLLGISYFYQRKKHIFSPDEEGIEENTKERDGINELE